MHHGLSDSVMTNKSHAGKKTRNPHVETIMKMADATNTNVKEETETGSCVHTHTHIHTH